ncbi:TetR/AcrR family transcriptional regulator [Kurthia sibirica]|uniref:HTH tetR-type domain-containing protein n=1 Tax=Kurthia sibirica TaxID=202750 RepID=A0A2U3AJL3_9BACL|nr:TetR-like C-terminal domain-containing protein [Kurthia sibirica]PWI24710.1 hypothetical protein DEX24_12155 [Kurthia sibirica]GEK34736.1 transcriptional regulator [Kurthia sibirica]
MTIEQTDLRIKRTKKLLNHAFVELLEEKPFDKISVNALTAAAEINRVTFYLHYQNMEDFIESFIDELFISIEHIFNKQKNETISLQIELHIMEEFLTFIGAKHKIFRSLLVSKSVPYFTTLFHELIRNFMVMATEVNDNQFKALEADQVEKDIAFWYFSSALIGTISMWLASDLKYSPSYLATQIVKLNPMRKTSIID